MRLVHLADLHLGFRAYGRTTRQGINRREADVFVAFREALTKITTLAPDLLLIAGDVFHVTRPSNLTVVQTQRSLQQFIQETGIQTIVIAGNHESVRSSDNRCILELLDLIPNVTVVCEQPETILHHSQRLRIVCLPHNSLSEIPSLDLRPDPSYSFNVLMLHGTVDANLVNDYGGYEVPSDLLEMPWDYVACGHFHSYRHIKKHIYYSGAIERTSNDIWKEADEEKGFVEFDLEHKKAVFHALTTRKTIDLPIIDAQGKSVVTIDQLIIDQAQQVDISDCLVRQRVINLSKTLQRQLNFRQIRSLQMQALHYLFVPTPTENATEISSWERTHQEGSLIEEAQKFLLQRNLPSEIDRDGFVAKGIAYLNM